MYIEQVTKIPEEEEEKTKTKKKKKKKKKSRTKTNLSLQPICGFDLHILGLASKGLWTTQPNPIHVHHLIR